MEEHQVIKLDNSPNVNDLSVLNETVQVVSSLDNMDTIASSISDFSQQTLIDVNSQPLIPLFTQRLIDDALANSMEDLTDNKSGGKTPLYISEFYDQFTVGKTYEKLEDLRSEAYKYGKKHNVPITTSKSDKTKIYLSCKHAGEYRKNFVKRRTDLVHDGPIKTRCRKSQKTGCPCLIYARCKRGSWYIRKRVAEHNHIMVKDPRNYAMFRSLTPEQLDYVHKLLEAESPVQTILKELQMRGVNNVVSKDIENISQNLKRKQAAEGTSTATTLT